MKKLTVEYKKGFEPCKDSINTGKVLIMFTPAINQDYYIMRVVLYKDQALVAFPKFGLIGVGFAIEEGSWNANLPYDVEVERLYKHIRCNKKYRAITKQTCLEGLKLLQAACKAYEEEKAKKEIVLNMRGVDNMLSGAVSEIRKAKRMQYSKN